MITLQTNIKQVNDAIDALRNKDNNIEFDYDEIKKMSHHIPFKKHPLFRLKNESAVQLYLETLVNMIKLDDKNNEDLMDTRFVFIQYLLNSSAIDITLEELIKNSLKVRTSEFDELTTQLSKKYKEHLIVDLLIVANLNGTFNADECSYVVDMLTILGIDAARLKTLAFIAKMVLCQKTFAFDRSLGNDLVNELKNYRHYVLSNSNAVVPSMSADMIKESIKAMRIVVVDIPDDEAVNFRWKSKQNEKVVSGDLIATYQIPKKKRGYSFAPEYTTKEIFSPTDGTIFQFKDNHVIYGVVSHENDNKDSIKHWVINGSG